MKNSCCLASEPVESATLPLQSIDHIHGGDSFPLGVFSVGDGITDDVFEKNFENAARFFINET